MPDRHRTTAELVAIAAEGINLLLDAGARSAAELAEISTAARKSGAKVTITGTAAMSAAEREQIATAGGGYVVFESW